MDQATLAKYRQGDRATLRALYDEHLRVVFVVVRRDFVVNGKAVPGVIEPAAQQDLLQDTFIRAFSSTARQRYSGEVPFRAYLLQITRNLMIDRARAAGRAELVNLDDNADVIDASESSEEAIDEARRAQRVQQYLLTLDEEHRAVFRLRFDDNLSERDAAEALQVTRRRIRTLHDHLVEGFRRFWGSCDD